MAKLKVLFLIVSLMFTGQAFGQDTQNSSVTTLLQQGMDLYGKGKWREAVLELRRAQGLAQTNAQRTQALYWISLAEIGAGEYEAAVRDIEELENTAAPGALKQELAYNKGRCYYYLGRYEEAMVLLKNYADSAANEKKYAAYFWIGESLFSLGQLDRARDIFTLIIQDAPQSTKYEAATYRIALINQKKVETELLNILKWSHEESLKTMEEYQRRERSYDQAIIAYQKRIAELLKDTRLADLESSNALYKNQLADAQNKIALLEANIREMQISLDSLRGSSSRAGTPTASERTQRLGGFRAEAQTLLEELQKGL
ncbi:hypothetical protein FACS1894200_06730 [Spirochaetia bacterium]|nr:hypothetical protein FACS1894200_06730 [Spirochaetia bacterium]